jgi:hypothetical protein
MVGYAQQIRTMKMKATQHILAHQQGLNKKFPNKGTRWGRCELV